MLFGNYYFIVAKYNSIFEKNVQINYTTFLSKLQNGRINTLTLWQRVFAALLNYVTSALITRLLLWQTIVFSSKIAS